MWAVTSSVWDFTAAMGAVIGAVWAFTVFMWNVALCGLLMALWGGALQAPCRPCMRYVGGHNIYRGCCRFNVVCHILYVGYYSLFVGCCSHYVDCASSVWGVEASMWDVTVVTLAVTVVIRTAYTLCGIVQPLILILT